MTGDSPRRLAAILAADVVGYSRLMGEDEAGTLSALRRLRAEVFTPLVKVHRGKVVKSMGDGWLVAFAAAADAVTCAIALQETLAAEEKIKLRTGVHLGDITHEAEDIFGDGVNIAARLQEIAAPGSIVISDVARRSIDGKLAAAFTDLGVQRLKNIREPVTAYGWGITAVPEALRAFPPSDKPSIAVLPFANLSGDPEQAYFADGLVEDIITTLSKLEGLRVIARNSSFLYKDQAVDIREVARQLDVRFVLEGSVRRAGPRLRITAQLIEAASGSHLWAERYDRALDDIFAVQDEITLVLATELQVKLTEGEQARLHYTTTSNVEAWSHWVKGLAFYRQAITRENFTQAKAHWEKALALDPASAALNGAMGYMHYMDVRFGWWEEKQTALQKARRFSDRALDLDPESPDGHTASSLTCLVEGHYEEAAAHARRAAALAPGSADAVAFACVVLTNTGYPQEAIPLGERAMNLSPNYPASYLGQLGNCYRLAGKIAEAMPAFEAYHARSPGFGLLDLVICHQASGHPEEAKRRAQELLAIRRDFTITAWAKTQFRADKAGIETDMAALQAAGLPLD